MSQAYCAAFEGEHMTAIPSRNACHQGGTVVAAATNSGRVHIYRT